MFITKMHGLGNDFIVIEDDGSGVDYNRLSATICDRHLGAGADGVLVVLPSPSADIRMRIFNSDGSEAEMCGNGIRCFARYVYDKHIVSKSRMSVETLAGVMRPEINHDGDKLLVRVYMGRPAFEREKIPMSGAGAALGETLEIAGHTLSFSSLLMGVPHTVVFTQGIEKTDTATIGPLLEKHALFPRKTNVNFIEVVDRRTLRNKTWERGAGFTLACGTGACAAVVAASLRGLVEKNAVVRLPAGELLIEYTDAGDVYMTGPAEYVLEGRLLMSP